MRKNITKILGWKSENTYYDWKKQKRPIIELLEKYFIKEELEEFLKTGEIKRLEKKDEDENLIQKLIIDNAIFSVKEKIKSKTVNSYKNDEVIIKACESINNELENINYENAKQRLIDVTKGVEIAVFGIKKLKAPKKSEDIAKWIKDNISNIEAFSLLQNYKEIFSIIKNETKYF